MAEFIFGKNEIKVFIAGGKALLSERDTIVASLSENSNKNSKGILIRAFTYRDFDTSFIVGGRQITYEQFIEQFSDYIIFVLDNEIGGISEEEFNVAMNSFMSKGKPGIYVYHNSKNKTTSKIKKIIRRINKAKQYYTDYDNIVHLRDTVAIHFWDVLDKHPLSGTGALGDTLKESTISEDHAIKKLVDSSSQQVKNVDDAKYKKRMHVLFNNILFKKIFLRVFLSLLGIMFVLGTSLAVARKTLRYEYDYSQSTATVVAKKAFFRCRGYVNIPERVKHKGQYFEVRYIGAAAFINYSGLTSITIPNGVIGIEDKAFAGCHNLTSVIIPNSVISIGEEAFYDCHGMKTVTIGNSVKTIGNRAFRGCTGITSITIPNSVTNIGYAAFMYCINMKSLSIGNGVTCIESNAFNGCDKLTAVSIPTNVIKIGKEAFPEHTKIIQE